MPCDLTWGKKAAKNHNPREARRSPSWNANLPLLIGRRSPSERLYGAVDRLLKAGVVAVDREEIVDGRARRYFT
jgi:hypothetical protein